MQRMRWSVALLGLWMGWASPAAALNESALYYGSGLSRLISPRVFDGALQGYRQVPGKRKALLTIIDYSKPSNERRLFILDMVKGRLLAATWVSHGRNSGDEWAHSFSDRPDSLQSSLGLYRTAETYLGKYGYSLRLDGLTPGKNLNARKRAIVLHGAPYASPAHLKRFGKLGRSWGCPAVPLEQAPRIIRLIEGGSVIYAYGSNRQA
ncbi:murein L,D-transpeptidase catalytic domain family protein [Aeromonas diversa]|uniref:Uncharacterized protein n=1 Tax=Aeromonas diversa CDC 2478-85 TaxID=1268237 RepID=N9U4H7_9GAMM|nr:murein L,D-transpeptidase catalytic domain family protein [Aeromonas diversa]ENY73259.1 hypothetical protein G114_03883 [Aeromonas diversa CDC 2478-85]